VNFEQLLKPKASEAIPGRGPRDKGALDCGSKTKAECDKMKMELTGALQNKKAPPKGPSSQAPGTPDARFGHHFGSIPVQEPPKKMSQAPPKAATAPKPLPPKAAAAPPKAQPPKPAPPAKTPPKAPPKTPAVSNGTKKEKP
jgi:hypothetical protein